MAEIVDLPQPDSPTRELTPESYASYVTDIEGMRLLEALDAMQQAYDRYLSNQ